MITWKETRARMLADRQRLLDYLREEGEPAPWFPVLHPSYMACFLYRLSHYLRLRGWKLPARILWHLNITLTGLDVNPKVEIGPGFLIVHPACCTIAGKIGAHCTMFAQSGIGGAKFFDTRDIGAGPGVPLVEDDVYFEPGAIAIGPIRIGSGCRLGARTVCSSDLPPGSITSVAEAKVRTIEAPQHGKKWSYR